MATVTRRTCDEMDGSADTVHEETCSSMTACGLRIGSYLAGWESEGKRVTCPGCLAALRASAQYMANID